MATFTKKILSGSTDGKSIKVAASATAGTTIHTGATTPITTLDEVWIYAVNSSSSSVKLTIEWGEATAPDGNIEFTVPAESGLYLIVPGLPLQGNATALVVKAFAATANVVIIHGFVNEIA